MASTRVSELPLESWIAPGVNSFPGMGMRDVSVERRENAEKD